MKKLTSKTKKIMVATGSAVICVGVLCAVLFQQSANAAAVNAVKHKSTSSVTSTTSTVSVPPIHKDTASSTAKVESAWTPSKGENKTTSLAPAAPKAAPPATKPKIAGDSVNGKQPTNGALTDKSKKPSYPSKDTTPQKDNTQTKNNGGNYNDPVFGNKTGTGGQGTVVKGDWGSGEQVGIMD